ncbi:NADH dehydrogenase [ubiquinone] iron-sulfur protein 4, mitochondrial-like [Portunus trituberculatus]|uniref:NADH dehydrogenase [ubiquinone] iron-sulfur protein 4, mitochondrial-like n=1 Tax=Portunus trituberculatus TaxID=210409 RepID=UPI001E1CC678|nr:NADH dehydrogenase [ubiquinone] iron-sulfur protein 4, mitochondrial-like [Portunus trituberculatus]
MALRLTWSLLSEIPIARCHRTVSTSAARYVDDLTVKQVEPKSAHKTLMTSEEESHEKAVSGYITIDTPHDVSPIAGVPEEQLKTRRVLIKVPTKNSMQSGTNNLHRWQISFDEKQRWENPLMGWSSTADPLSNTEVSFSSREDAIAFCEKHGWNWITENPPVKPPRVKSYGANFSWNRRTRRSTK